MGKFPIETSSHKMLVFFGNKPLQVSNINPAWVSRAAKKENLHEIYSESFENEVWNLT